MTENEVIFENMKRLADSIVNTFGKNCEVAIHDLSDLQHSLVYIAGEVTRRTPGAPITDLVVRALREEGDGAGDLCNYRSKTADGKNLKCSSTFIRDGRGKPIGVFCINYDIVEFQNAIGLLEHFVKTDAPEPPGGGETFAGSVSETIASLISQGIAMIGKQPSTMTKEEKVNLVRILEGKGLFLIKGAVDQLALAMGVSKFTVYNYLQQVRAELAGNVV